MAREIVGVHNLIGFGLKYPIFSTKLSWSMIGPHYEAKIHTAEPYRSIPILVPTSPLRMRLGIYSYLGMVLVAVPDGVLIPLNIIVLQGNHAQSPCKGH
jgi:hypothetical protein